MDKFAIQDHLSIMTEPINYKMFVKMFNGISGDYKAVRFPGSGAVIMDDAEVVASLGSQSMGWQFNSATFDWDELKLMVDLASTMPIYRDKSDDNMVAWRKAWVETRLSEMEGDE